MGAVRPRLGLHDVSDKAYAAEDPNMVALNDCHKQFDINQLTLSCVRVA